MAIVWLSGLGGAAAVVNTSPKLSPRHSGSPHFRLLEALIEAAPGTPGAPVELDAEFGTILPLSVVNALRKHRAWKLSPSQIGAFLTHDFTLFSILYSIHVGRGGSLVFRHN